MVTLDTSAVIALLDEGQDRHREASAFVQTTDERLVLPAATLGEIGHIVERRFGKRVLLNFALDLLADAYLIDAGTEDLARVVALMRRYDDLSLGLVDAAVIACAERNGGRVLTYDYRHFGTVAAEGTITLVH